MLSTPISIMASPSREASSRHRRAVSRNNCRLPISLRARPSIAPPSAAHALTATSGPSPAGSPWLMTMGCRVGRPSSCLDNGVPPQVAQVALCIHAHLLDKKLLLQFGARGKLKRDQLGRRFIAAHDDFEAGRREERLGNFSGARLGNRRPQFGAQLFEIGRAE